MPRTAVLILLAALGAGGHCRPAAAQAAPARDRTDRGPADRHLFGLRAVAYVTRERGGWTPPPEYVVPNVAETVCRIVTSFRIPDAAELEWTRRERT